MADLLHAEGLVAGYGSHQVLHGVSLAVSSGEVLAMVGLNGAGKSVTLRCISGLLLPWGGSVRIGEVDVTRFPPERRVRAGLATVPQGRGIFPDLSVAQNLRLGGYRISGAQFRRRSSEVLARFPRLAERSDQRAGTLSGGEQAMLAVARALVCHPQLLLLDEPTAGLSPRAARDLMTLLRELNAEGMTMLLVEQNIGVALSLASRVLLMQKGTIVRSAEPGSLQDRRTLLAELGAGELSAELTKEPEAPRPVKRSAPRRSKPAATGSRRKSASQ